MVFFTIYEYTEGTGVSSDLALGAAILIFVGGLIFWFMIACAAVMGVCRGMKRLYDSAREVLSRRRVHPAE